MNRNLWASLNQGAASGVLAGGYPYAPNNWYVRGGSLSAPTFGRQVGSLEELFAIAQPGDVAFLGPGEYAEGNLVIPETLTNFTMIGTGGRGSAFIEAPDAGDEGLQVLADDVTLVNIGVAGASDGDHSLRVGSQTINPARFRAYGCKFEGNEGALPAGSCVIQGAGDVLLEDCEFAWSANALVLAPNDNGFVTQIYVRDCLFHNYTNAGLVHSAVAQVVVNLWLRDCTFGRQEDGTAGTDDILLSDNGNNGLITGNRFSRATNGTGFITIGTGLIYNPNGTEAGWSTARPA